MISVVYPIQLPAVHKLVDRLCRKHSSEIIFTLLDEEGYRLITTLPASKQEEINHSLFRYSCLFDTVEHD